MPWGPRVLRPPRAAYPLHGVRRFSAVRRGAALMLMVVGQSALALLAPPFAALPALASFLAAGLVLAR